VAYITICDGATV